MGKRGICRKMEGSTTGVQVCSINILIEQNRTEQYVNSTHEDSYQYVLLEHFSEAGVGGGSRRVCRYRNTIVKVQEQIRHRVIQPQLAGKKSTCPGSRFSIIVDDFIVFFTKSAIPAPCPNGAGIARLYKSQKIIRDKYQLNNLK